MNDLATKIEAAGSEVEQTRGAIDTMQARVDASEQQYAALQQQLSDRAVETFMHGTGESLEIILGASSMAELSDRIEFLGAVSQRDADLAIVVQNKLYELDIARSELQGLLAQQQITLNGLEQDRTDLESTFAEQQAAFDEAQSLRAEAETFVSRLDEKLQQELQPPPPPASSGGDGIRGPLYACPVNGPHAYADTFGQVHVHPGWTHIHQGNDISAPYGTPIVAPFDGTAVSGSDDTAGIFVTVTGSQGFVQMLHMSSLGNLGAVRTGDVVGYIGTTGLASGPHTHFEWHPAGGAAVDPYPQLNEVC
jgi:murein DD-endopeptidase MepM/ murein hydrolase activator NlpD